MRPGKRRIVLENLNLYKTCLDWGVSDNTNTHISCRKTIEEGKIVTKSDLLLFSCLCLGHFNSTSEMRRRNENNITHKQPVPLAHAVCGFRGNICTSTDCASITAIRLVMNTKSENQNIGLMVVCHPGQEGGGGRLLMSKLEDVWPLSVSAGKRI